MGSPIKRARVESKMFPERASGSLGIASAPHCVEGSQAHESEAKEQCHVRPKPCPEGRQARRVRLAVNKRGL